MKEQRKNEKSGGGVGDASEKLGRNRDKLNTALVVYTNASNALITAINDVCDNGWRELQPLLLKLIQFERTYNTVAITCSKELEGMEQMLNGIGEQVRRVGSERQGPGARTLIDTPFFATRFARRSTASTRLPRTLG